MEELNLNYYHNIYNGVLIDYCKKTDLVKKLTYTTMFNEKIKVGYEEEMKRLEEFEIKFYNKIVDNFLQQGSYFGYSEI